MQSLIPAIYPIIKDKYALDFVQVGIITLTFQIAGSLWQPLVGNHTGQHPMPYSTAVGRIFTRLRLLSPASPSTYIIIPVSVAFAVIGSSSVDPSDLRAAP